MTDLGNQLLANIFKALAHPTRVQIVKLLKDGPLCVCFILPKIDSEQSNTSQHLSILRNQGILDNKKTGSKVIYGIKSPEVLQMIELAEKLILKQIDETKDSLRK
ncbi:MAG: metalloregulator ArsR/SmtB family transcription factor [Clostridia bacterium]|jgi:ArsR family transcriptional regulator